MANKDSFRKYVEAGTVLGQITRARAEEVVRDLVGAGEVQRGQAQDWIDDLVERSRRASEDLVKLVRAEVSSQLASLGIDADDLAKQVADILRQSAGMGRKATTTEPGSQHTTAHRKDSLEAGLPATIDKAAKAVTKKAAASPTKTTAAKRTAVKKTAASPTKTTAAKRSAVKKTVAKKPANREVPTAEAAGEDPATPSGMTN